jgi:hypothetical protein
MTALTLMITRAGQARFTAAQLDADINLGIAQIGLTDVPFVSAPTLERLPGEFKRIASISGAQVGDNIVHMTIRDESDDGYSARGFGLFLADGTLFATYAQEDRLFEKSPRATFLAAIDIAFPAGDVSELRFGNTDFLNSPATTERKGVVELATEAEAVAGTDMQRVASVGVMAKVFASLNTRLTAYVDSAMLSVGQALDGLAGRTTYGSGLVTGGGRNDTNRTLSVAVATAADIRAGTAPNKAITPEGLAAAGIVYLVEAKSDGSSRYRRYSDGLIEMTGMAALPGSESTFTLNFPWPFANECEGLFATIVNTAQTNDGQSTVQEVALTINSATLYAQNHKTPTADAAGGFRWFARGR